MEKTGRLKRMRSAEEGERDQPMAEADAVAPAEKKERDDAPPPEESVLVFVVHKIRSVDRGEHGRFIVFTVVGCVYFVVFPHRLFIGIRSSALFYTPFPEEGASPSSAIFSVEFPVPVIDFTVGPDGNVWSLLDAEWAGAQASSSSESPQFARLLSWEGSTVRRSLAFCPSCRSESLSPPGLAFRDHDRLRPARHPQFKMPRASDAR